MCAIQRQKERTSIGIFLLFFANWNNQDFGKSVIIDSKLTGNQNIKKSRMEEDSTLMLSRYAHKNNFSYTNNIMQGIL